MSARSALSLLALAAALAAPAPASAAPPEPEPASASDGKARPKPAGTTKPKGTAKPASKPASQKKPARPAPPAGPKAAPGPDARPDARPGAGDNPRTPSPLEPRPEASPTRPSPAPAVGPSPRGTPVRAPSQSFTEARRRALDPTPRVPKATRPFDSTRVPPPPPPWRAPDHRFARPDWRHVRPYPLAPTPPPPAWTYRPWYTHWWVHPYWRCTHATVVVVRFPFVVHAWVAWWVPPPRPGWVWAPGYWAYGYWHPGFWRPLGPPPMVQSVAYLYVPGWWQGDVYVDGYWRPSARPDGDWVWVDGYYLDDGGYLPGHWRPAGYGPEGYVWEAGFFDGETWVDGFWRPEYFAGYVWVSAWFDEDGVYHSGYWEPTDERPGQVWVPGWFDGTQWVRGYWVGQAEYEAADPVGYQPEVGWNDGWDQAEPAPADEPALPLALPVVTDGLSSGE